MAPSVLLLFLIIQLCHVAFGARLRNRLFPLSPYSSDIVANNYIYPVPINNVPINPLYGPLPGASASGVQPNIAPVSNTFMPASSRIAGLAPFSAPGTTNNLGVSVPRPFTANSFAPATFNMMNPMAKSGRPLYNYASYAPFNAPYTPYAAASQGGVGSQLNQLCPGVLRRIPGSAPEGFDPSICFMLFNYYFSETNMDNIYGGITSQRPNPQDWPVYLETSMTNKKSAMQSKKVNSNNNRCVNCEFL